jgi:hypothetical protein
MLGGSLVVASNVRLLRWRPGVSGDGVAAQSCPKRTKSFQQIAVGDIDSRQSRLANFPGVKSPVEEDQAQKPPSVPFLW